MKRRIFNLLAGVSLLLFAGSVVLWIWSYFDLPRMYTLPCAHGNPIVVYGYKGLICFNGYNAFPFGKPVHFRILLFRIYTRWSPQSTRPWLIGIPFYAPTLLASILPVWFLVGRIFFRRPKMIGCCKSCGYDLRATPDRCPECGDMTV